MTAPKLVSARRLCLLFLVIGTLASCGGSGGSSALPTSPAPQPPQNNVAQAYVNEVIAIMRENIVTRFDVDWDDLETQVNQLAANANI